MWALAALWLIALSTAFAVHWLRHRHHARGYANHPVMSQFYGAPAMALLTVGSGTLLLGSAVIGARAAVLVDALLWTAGTVLGLAVAVAVPLRMITHHDHDTAAALPAWLMPVVSPMVSASCGALLLEHAGAGQLGMTLLAACYAMFGLSLIAGLITIALIYSRLLHAGLPETQAVPTVWITLGMIGQSITAANLLAAHAPAVLSDASLLAGLHVFGIVYGLVMGGFGAFMFSLAVALTVHATRRGLRFSLTWWSFTFPVGTCVTGASALSAATHLEALRLLAVLLYIALVAAWATVASHTARKSLAAKSFRF